jgi:hypothetical protein
MDIVFPSPEQNFAVNIADAQLSPQLFGPDGSKTAAAASLDRLDFCFTCLFVVELLVNLYANWLAPFLRSAYNVVDAAVIVLSVATLAGASVLPMSVVRTLRAFRALRLFGKFRCAPIASIHRTMMVQMHWVRGLNCHDGRQASRHDSGLEGIVGEALAGRREYSDAVASAASLGHYEPSGRDLTQRSWIHYPSVSLDHVSRPGPFAVDLHCAARSPVVTKAHSKRGA